MRAKEEGRGFRETGRRACEGLRSARDGGRRESARGRKNEESLPISSFLVRFLVLSPEPMLRGLL